MRHTVKHGFHTHPVKINLVGVGGGGSLVLSGLVRLHLAMKGLGHPYGLDVEVWDPDAVSEANMRFRLSRILHQPRSGRMNPVLIGV